MHEVSSGVYGQLKIWDDLSDEGTKVARCTVERLMRAHGIEGLRNGKAQRTTLPGPSPVAAPDLVRRDFSAGRPDAVRLADFTYVRTWEGWSYLAAVLDVHTRRRHRSLKRTSNGRTRRHAPLQVLEQYNQQASGSSLVPK